MDEVVELVMKKTGLEKDTATAAVKVVVDFLKKKMPAPVGKAMDAYLSGEGDVASAMDMFGGLFDNKK
jgi:hypothetical protein